MLVELCCYCNKVINRKKDEYVIVCRKISSYTRSANPANPGMAGNDSTTEYPRRISHANCQVFQLKKLRLKEKQANELALQRELSIKSNKSPVTKPQLEDSELHTESGEFESDTGSEEFESDTEESEFEPGNE